MSRDRSRRTFLAGLATAVIGGGAPRAVRADALPVATVYKSPT